MRTFIFGFSLSFGLFLGSGLSDPRCLRTLDCTGMRIQHRSVWRRPNDLRRFRRSRTSSWNCEDYLPAARSGQRREGDGSPDPRGHAAVYGDKCYAGDEQKRAAEDAGVLWAAKEKAKPGCDLTKRQRARNRRSAKCGRRSRTSSASRMPVRLSQGAQSRHRQKRRVGVRALRPRQSLPPSRPLAPPA